MCMSYVIKRIEGNPSFIAKVTATPVFLLVTQLHPAQGEENYLVISAS